MPGHPVAIGDPGDQQPQRDPLSVAGQETQAGVPLEKRILGTPDGLHLKEMVGLSEHRRTALLGGAGGRGQRGTEILGPTRQEVDVVHA